MEAGENVDGSDAEDAEGDKKEGDAEDDKKEDGAEDDKDRHNKEDPNGADENEDEDDDEDERAYRVLMQHLQRPASKALSFIFVLASNWLV